MSKDDDDELGGRFWLGVAGLGVAAVCVALIVFIIMGRFWSRWGFFGALLGFFALLLIIGWVWDRRERARKERLYAETE